MLDRDVRFEGFDADDWTRLLELMSTGADPDAGLIVVHSERQVVKAYRTGGGAPFAVGDPWPQSLPSVGERASVGWVLSAEAGALDEWSSRIARRISRSDDLLDQLIVGWQEARQLAAEGRLETWPTALAAIPVPSRGMLLGAVGLICAPEQTLVVAAWDAGDLWTSLVLRRSGEGFDRIVGPDEFRADVRAMGPSTDAMWGQLSTAIVSELGPISLGIAAERSTWKRLAGTREPGGWARAVASGEVVLDPFPPGLALPLAVDVSRMAWVAVRTAFGRRLGAMPGGDGSLAAEDFASLWRVAQGLWSLQRRSR